MLSSVVEVLTQPIGPPPFFVCPAQNVDGSMILANTSCTLVDHNGVVYQFDGNGPTNQPNFSGNYEFAGNSVPNASAIALQRNTGGQIYMLQTMGPSLNPNKLWFLWTSSDQPQAVTPASGPVGNVFANLTTGATYRTGAAMIAAAVTGNLLQIPLMPVGIAQWWDAGAVRFSNVTITGTTGAIFGGSNALGQGCIVALANNLTVSNLTIANGNDGSPTSGVRADNTCPGLTVTGCTIHDCDHGILTGSSTGGTTTVTNTTIFNCGDLSGRNTFGSTHNAYIGNEDAINVQNVTSYNTLSGGHTWKTRAKVGTIGTVTGCIFAQLTGDSTCCIDIPCGGHYQIQNCILERGQKAENNRFMTFGVEISFSGGINCDMNSRLQNMAIDNCWFIDDGPLNGTATQICQNAFADTGVNVILTNCKIVSNPATSPVILGGNVTDGGGNKFYSSRAAAIAAGENIPLSYDGTLACLPPLPASNKIAALLASMPAGTWAQAPSSNLSSVQYGTQAGDDPALTSAILGGSGPAAIMNAWSGGCYDPDHDQLIIRGGGHTDYWGNEVYAFDFSSLTMKRLTKPSDPTSWLAAGGTSGEMGDGDPIAAHTYDSLAYVPGKGLYMIADLGLKTGGGVPDSFLFNPGAQNGPGNIGVYTRIVDFSLGQGPGIMAKYDSVTGKIFATMLSNRLVVYDTTTNTWAPAGPNVAPAGVGFQSTAVIDPVHRLFICVGNPSFNIPTGTCAFNLDGTVANNTGATGDTTVMYSGNGPGLAWHQGLGKVVGWNGGSTLYILDTVLWTWTAHPAAASQPATGIPTSPQFNGTYGRFGYNATHNCFYVVNDITQNVYIYKPDF